MFLNHLLNAFFSDKYWINFFPKFHNIYNISLNIMPVFDWSLDDVSLIAYDFSLAF